MTRRRDLQSIGWTALAVFALIVPLSAGEVRAEADRVEQLVAQLGSPVFAERERASRELIAMGVAARDALASATKSADAEVRARARAVLATVSDSEFRDRLEAFSADFDGSGKQSLPGWERYSAQLGNSRLARQLFVEMQRSESELLAAYAQGGKAASDALDARCRALLGQLSQATAGDGPGSVAAGVSIGTLASLLLIGSADDVAVDEQVAFQLFTWLIYRPGFHKNATGGTWAPIIKRLLGMWIVKDASPSATAQNLIFAATFELKPEGLSLAGRLLASDGTSPQVKQYALLSLGRFGSREHVAIAEKFLNDPTGCGALQVPRPPRQIEVQVRDVALAVLVHLTGQNVREYGAAQVQPNPQSYFQVAALAFPSPAIREAALKRWNEWRAEHPQP